MRADLERARTCRHRRQSVQQLLLRGEDHSALVIWAKEKFRAFHIYVPDGPARFTLEALGYPEARARQKAARQARWLFNKIRLSLDAADLGATTFDEVVLCSGTLDGNDAYRRLLDDVERAFERDPCFRRGCTETSRWVPDGWAGGANGPAPEKVHHAVRYFKAELPLFMNTPELVGVSSSVFVYHQCPPFLERLFLERRGDLVSAQQGFASVVAE